MLSNFDWTLPIPPNVKFEWLNPSGFNDVLEECAQLYSQNYGKWGKGSVNPGNSIKLSSVRLQDLIAGSDSKVAVAKHDESIIGYAFAKQLKIPSKGLVSWVTQLVVHKNYRHLGIAKRLLNGIWGFSNHYAWGIVTANPYAVRALEKATRRRCDPICIQRLGNEVLNAGKQVINYIEEAEPTFNQNISAIDTKFYVDTSEFPLNTKLRTDWKLGNLEEWFAFTFREQDEFPLMPDELNVILADADQIVQRAYSGMTLDSAHSWTNYTSKEVEYLFDLQVVQSGNKVLDFGCGSGRHAIELAQKGCNVTGVDFVETLIDKARDNARQLSLNNLTFIHGDCRNINLDVEFDAAICLYDVIGSFPNERDNTGTLENLVRHVKVGGLVLISVLNFRLTLDQAKAEHKVNLYESTKTLLDLPPSKTMQDSGQIFNPDYYLIDNSTNIVYRKEQFDLSGLPCELVVRDRRYLRDDFIKMCENAGLEMIFCKPVQAGKWSLEPPLEENSPKAKELLYYGRRVRNENSILTTEVITNQLNLFTSKQFS
jgi:2-polyprenyl-3-methyl-5-hydroxy-6-metoxy-1,4-benzoquinol methylase/GNAT superfamily N-acetyltransferase